MSSPFNYMKDNRIGFLITPEVLEELEAMYPDRCPQPSMSEREIWMAVGARGVVDTLKTRHEQAQEYVSGPGMSLSEQL